jgi:hypothetical protein
MQINTLGGLLENEIKNPNNEQKSMNLMLLEKNIPQFKCVAVRDLYLFLLKRYITIHINIRLSLTFPFLYPLTHAYLRPAIYILYIE